MRVKDNQVLMLKCCLSPYFYLLNPSRSLSSPLDGISVFGGHTLQITRDTYVSLGPDDSDTFIYRQTCLQIPKTQLKSQCSGKYHILITLLFFQKSISLFAIFLNACQFISTIISRKRNESSLLKVKKADHIKETPV